MPRPKKNPAHQPSIPEPQPRPETKPMPSLLFNEVHFDNSEETETFPEPASFLEEELSFHHSIPYRPTPLRSGLLPTNNPPPPRGARGYMWLSIGVVMVVVIATWIFSLPNHLSLGQFKNGSEFSLFKASQAKWEATALTPETKLTTPSSGTVNTLEDAIKKLNLADNQVVTPTSTEVSTTTALATPSSTPTSTFPNK